MKRPISPFLDNNPKFGFYGDVRERTSTSKDPNVSVPTPSAQSSGAPVGTSESPTPVTRHHRTWKPCLWVEERVKNT